MVKKFKEIIKELNSDENLVRRILYYLFIICSILIIIVWQLTETNEYLRIIANANGGKLQVVTDSSDDFEYEKITTEEKDIYDYIPQAPVETEPYEDPTAKIEYVINTNSNKIHYPDCSYGKKINEENKKTVVLNKSELEEYLNNGYTMCSSCGGK